MRRLLHFLFLTIAWLNNSAQSSGVSLDSQLTKTQTENLYVLAKVWGFLKYHHPNVAKGKSSFDQALFKIMKPIANATDVESRNTLLLNWMNELGDETATEPAAPMPTDRVHKKPALEWINNRALFSDAMVSKLNSVYTHRNSGSNAYVKLVPKVLNPDFDGEEKYEGMTAGDDGLRMLALFRYWNTIEYFFPSRYLIKENWDDVLKEFIPLFAAGRSMISYKLNCLKLINRIHDTHAAINSDDDLGRYFGTKFSAFRARMIEGKLVVYIAVSDSLAMNDPVTVGDEIVTINGKTIAEHRKELDDFLCASNASAANRNFVSYLLRGNGDRLAITYEHDGMIKTGSLTLYPQKIVNEASVKKYNAMVPYKLLNDSVGYITLATAKVDDLKTMFKTFEHTKGIVIDIRNYPAGFFTFEMARYIKPAPSPFVKFTNGNIENPGLFTFKYELNNGEKNKDYYKGKIVILVDERTQSSAEYQTMALRTAPNAVVIGSQTAGADGNVSKVYLPGGVSTYISGIGVFYPDGKETQGIGIVPDIEIRPTQAGIKRGADELLERALAYIANGK